ncbi:MAG: oligosaccharide flippase family protein [Eubacteriales bacterium]|nr:oligosaccharide flippase family protein [Eubacteriales bacterium]
MKANQLKLGAVLSYVSMGIGYIISIVYTPIMLRLLGQSEYGLYNLVNSVVSYLGLLSFGFGSAYIRYYSIYKAKDDQKNIQKLNGMFLIVYLGLGLVAVLAGLGLVFNIDVILGKKISAQELSTAKVLMAFMVFNIAISFPGSIFHSYITANEQYVFQNLLQIIRTVLSPFIMLPVLLMGYKSIGMVTVSTILHLIIHMGNIAFCIRKLNIRFSFKKFDFSLMKEIAVFSSYIFLNMIVDQINWNSDKFIIGRFKGTTAVATYGLAAQLNTYYITLSTNISNVFIPRINRMVSVSNNSSELTELFTRIGRLQFILLSLICSGFVFFGKPFIEFWAGADYRESYLITLLLIVPVTISLTQTLGIEIQKAKNMHKFRSWIYFAVAVVNICLSIPLTKRYGGVGAAAGTFIALIIGNGFCMNWYYHVRIGLDIKCFWINIFKILPSLILPILYGILTVSFVDLYRVQLFLIYGAFYVLLFSASVWLLGMNQYEKGLIANPVKKALRKISTHNTQ